VRESERGKDTATHCNTSQVFHGRHTHTTVRDETVTLHHNASHCNTLQHTATHCNALQHISTWLIDMHTTVRDETVTLQHTATHCNTLQRTATRVMCSMEDMTRVAVCCSVFFPCATRLSSACGMTHACMSSRRNTLQHTATHCNALQRTATHYKHFDMTQL